MPAEHDPDAALMLRVKQGDMGAFTELVDKYKRPVMNLAYRMLRDATESEDLAQNATRGVVNQISDVKLLKGDLSEAWREGGAEYASVAMRYAINDKIVERASGRVVDGGPQEVTERWTFRRAPGGSWILSAIQETSA